MDYLWRNSVQLLGPNLTFDSPLALAGLFSFGIFLALNFKSVAEGAFQELGRTDVILMFTQIYLIYFWCLQCCLQKFLKQPLNNEITLPGTEVLQ